VLSEDPLSIDSKDILDLKVVATFSRGKEIFNTQY
jgi:predicted amidohydrolase YtcJ